MDWTFVYLMFVLKLPIVGLLWIVWWAIHNTDEPASERTDGEGGTKLPRRPHPPLPRRRRPRGPHGEPAPPAPPRTRPTVVRARDTENT